MGQVRGGACLNKNKGRKGWLWDSKSGVGAQAGRGGARGKGQLAAQPLRPARGRAPRGNALEVYSEGYRQKEWHKRGCGGGAAYCGRGDGCCGGVAKRAAHGRGRAKPGVRPNGLRRAHAFWADACLRWPLWCLWCTCHTGGEQRQGPGGEHTRG